jgi:hypothetical protein
LQGIFVCSSFLCGLNFKYLGSLALPIAYVTPLKLGQSDEMDNVNAPQTCMILGILWDETFKKA